MKKISKILALVLVLVLSLTFGLVACKSDDGGGTSGGNDGGEDNKPGGHTHSFATAWEKDAEYHWHICSGCDKISGKEKHTWGTGEYITPPACGVVGEVKYTCTVCDATKTEATEPGDHTFEIKWTYDVENHWHKADCGHDIISDKGKHNFNENNICVDCGYKLIYTYGLEYTRDDSTMTATLTGRGLAVDKNIVVPSYIASGNGNYLVTTIKDEAFHNDKKLASIVISKGVTHIGEGAFANNAGLKKVILPDTLEKIGADAFMGDAQLGNVEFYNNLHTIDLWAFQGCKSLTKVSFPESLMGLNEAFLGCTGITEIEWLDEMPNLLNIDGAFNGCTGLTKVVLPKNSNYPITEDRKNYGNKDTFSGCTNLKEVVLPDNFYMIDAGAFKNCISLKKIDFGGIVVSIGDNAFNGCTGLVTFTLPSSVKQIGIDAFVDCKNLFEICNESTLNITVGSDEHGKIAKYARNVYTPSNGKSMITITDDGFAFIYDGKSAELFKYDGTTSVVKLPSTFVANDGTVVEKYTILPGIFSENKQIERFEVDENNKNFSIRNGALCDISNYGRYKIYCVPAGMTGAFEIDSEIGYIDENAFTGCDKITELTINSTSYSLTSLDPWIDSLVGLEKITINSSYIKDINDWTFSNNTNLQEIVATSNSKYTSEGGVLYSGTEVIAIPDCVGDLNNGKLVIREGTTKLPDSGLNQNVSITEVVLPASIEYIYYGFYYCSNLERIVFKGTVERFGQVGKTKINGLDTWKNGCYVDYIECSNGNYAL